MCTCMMVLADGEAQRGLLHDPDTWVMIFLALLGLTFVMAKRNHGFGAAVGLIWAMIVPLGAIILILGLGFGLLSEAADQWVEKQNNPGYHEPSSSGSEELP